MRPSRLELDFESRWSNKKAARGEARWGAYVICVLRGAMHHCKTIRVGVLFVLVYTLVLSLFNGAACTANANADADADTDTDTVAGRVRDGSLIGHFSLLSWSLPAATEQAPAVTTAVALGEERPTLPPACPLPSASPSEALSPSLADPHDDQGGTQSTRRSLLRYDITHNDNNNHYILSSSSSSITSSMEGSFSFYVLSLQWPCTVCALNPRPLTQNCEVPPATFTVSSLWPANEPLLQQPTCCDVPFSLPSILDLTPALRRFWPDLTPLADDIAQWDYQWRRYGSCSGLSQRVYFRRVLQLARQIDFVRALKVAGINISGIRRYPLDDIQRAVTAAADGFNVRIICLYDPAFPAPLLQKLQVCFSPSFELINCPLHLTHPDFNQSLCTAKRLVIPYGSAQLQQRNHSVPHSPSDGGSSQSDRLNLADAGLYVVASLAIFGAIIFCIFYQCRFAVQQSRHNQPSRTYYHPIHTSTSTTNL